MADDDDRDCRLLISSQNPDFRGGVLTLLRVMADWVRRELGIEPELAYGPARRSDAVNVSFRSVCRGRWRPTVRHEAYDGLATHCVGRMFPAFESLHCRGNLFLWQRLLDQYDVHQVVCGYAVTAVPHALCGKPFVAWIASSMDGDKRARMAESGLIRRTLHHVQAKELARLERFVLERAAWVLALSTHTYSELLERGADPARMSVLPCPVDVDRFKPAAKRPDRPTVICVGRHSDPRKNTALLVRAFTRVVQAVPDAQLTLVGDGDPARFRRMADELSLCNHLQFTGEISDNDLLRLYRDATVLAIPSEQEGLGIVGLEAMACGLPVVSTRCGGPEAFVIPGKTGLLVDANNERQMADALQYLLTENSTRETMGAQARGLVEEHYSYKRFSVQMSQVYATVRPDVFLPTQGDVGPLAEPAQL